MVEDYSLRVERFNDQNYQLWNMQMEDYLFWKYMYLLLSGKSKKMTSIKNKKCDLLDRKALGTIQLCLPVSMAFKISKEMTTEGLMTTLAKLYENSSASNKVFIMKRLFNMKISKGVSVVDHLNEFNTVTS